MGKIQLFYDMLRKGEKVWNNYWVIKIMNDVNG